MVGVSARVALIATVTWVAACAPPDARPDHPEADPELQDIYHKVNTLNVTLSLESAAFEDVIATLREITGLDILLDAAVAGISSMPEEKKIDFRVSEMVLRDVLNKVGDLFGRAWRVVAKERIILFTRRD